MARKSTRPFAATRDRILGDPETAAVYLEECLADGNIELFQEALKHVARAQGGMSAVSKQTGLNRESLYRALSKKGKPQLETTAKVLAALGMRFSITADNQHVK